MALCVEPRVAVAAVADVAAIATSGDVGHGGFSFFGGRFGQDSTHLRHAR